MSILTADQKAIAELPNAVPPADEGSAIVRDHKKITLHSNKRLALGIAGHTQDHYYIPNIEGNISIEDVLWNIRKHLEEFPRFYDRSSLKTLTSFIVNQGIASFFDENVDTYLTNTFLFSPIEIRVRLHRGGDEVQILHAGSGSEHFKGVVGLEDIEMLKDSFKNSRTPEACIPWIRDAYRKVSANDPGSGAEPVFLVSTRSKQKFRVLEYDGR